MFVLLNGSFGIGKTTLANLLLARLPGARLYDPERVGYVLRRLPAFVLGLRAQPADYQDLALWRGLILRGCRRAHRGHDLVIVPMAFTNADYFADLTAALAATAPVLSLCLVAPQEVVEARVARRAAAEGRPVTDFERKRVPECCRAHADGSFGALVDATGSPEAVAESVFARIEAARSGGVSKGSGHA